MTRHISDRRSSRRNVTATYVAPLGRRLPAEVSAGGGGGGVEIHSIVDHHKLVGGLATPGPVEIDVRPLCRRVYMT